MAWGPSRLMSPSSNVLARAFSTSARAYKAQGKRATQIAQQSGADHVAAYVPALASPPLTHGVHVATLQLTSNNAKTFELDFFADFAMRAAHALQILSLIHI